MKRFLSLFVSFFFGFCMADISEGSPSYITSVSSLSSSWLPEPNAHATFTIRISKPANSTGANLTVSLSNVTNYIGECGNDSGTSGPDLRLESSNNARWTQNSTGGLYRYISPPNSSQSSSESYTIKVTCYDYAAYGKLTITLGGSTFYRDIPLDNNDNKIADGWENRNGIYTSDVQSANALVTQDIDAGPNSNVGDGLSILDEYRGIKIRRIHTRTSPNSWDVFVTSYSAYGYGLASNLPNMTKHLLHTPEVSLYQIVNFYKTRGKSVYAIKVVEDTMTEENGVPITKLGAGTLGPPQRGSTTTIYSGVISRIASTDTNLPTSYLTPMTIGHEIGHCVNLHHCSVFDDISCIMYPKAEAGFVRYGSHHNPDYDVILPAADPQPPAPPPTTRLPPVPTTSGNDDEDEEISTPAPNNSNNDEDDHCPPSGSATRISGPPVWESDYYRVTYNYTPGRDYVTNPIIENVLNLSWFTKPAEDWYRPEYHTDGGHHYYMTVPSHDGFYIDEDGVGWFYACDYTGNYSSRVATDQDFGFSIVSISPEIPMFDTVDFRRDFYAYIVNDGGEMYLH